MSPQGIKSSEKASNSPGLCPVKGQKPSLAPREGPEINSRACLWLSPRPHPEEYCISSQNSRSPSPAFLLLCLGPIRGGIEVGNRKSDSNEIAVIL
jgi:hypothetical protein